MSVRTDLREGREAGVPLCCRLRWTLTYRLNPDNEQALCRGISLTRRRRSEYVPCGILHRATFTHAEYENLLAHGVRLSPE